jgi:glutamine cyclotransferase
VVALVVALVAVLVASCADGSTDRADGSTDRADGAAPATGDPDGCAPGAPAVLDVELLRTLEHDPDAYTQGLLVHDGRLYEGTGRVGESTLRELDLDDGRELDRVELPEQVFGEGLAVAGGDELVQLTWTDGVAYRWSLPELEPLGEHTYSGEGWGLTTLADGTLVMSDGSDVLTERDATDFEVLDRRQVLREGGPADQLNELEFDGESLWANRYRSDELLRIDPGCATVTGVADLSALRADATERAGGDPIDVTNGVAHLPGTDRFLLTGKWWPTMYEVRFVER